MDDFPFNPHNSRTADGVTITRNLWVWTNDMTLGRIVKDQTAEAEVGCCVRNGAEGHNTPAQVRLGTAHPGGWFSDHEAGGRFADAGCYCRHDHWFTVETENGTTAYNGERLVTYAPGLGYAIDKGAPEEPEPEEQVTLRFVNGRLVR